MLVLSRKVGQKIRIGQDIEITVTKVSGSRVTLGVSAPDFIRILRDEAEEKVEKKSAAPIVASLEESSSGEISVFA